jgi:hypothetical protein
MDDLAASAAAELGIRIVAVARTVDDRATHMLQAVCKGDGLVAASRVRPNDVHERGM